MDRVKDESIWPGFPDFTDVFVRRQAAKRFETAGVIVGFKEIVHDGLVFDTPVDAPMLYQHNNDYGWWEIEEKLQLARAKGLNMWSEHYPYEAASTNIGADALKPDALTAAGYTYEDNIYDPSADKFITEADYHELMKGDPAKIMVAFNNARIE